ncbi:MAG: hypothetical protein RLZZ546_612, partial [Bacteroidota bacterium]
MRLFLLLVFLFGSSICYSQKEDYNWAIGGYQTDPNIDIWGINILNFAGDKIELKKIGNQIHFTFTSSAISDKEGKPLFFSNGMDIYDPVCNIIQNGDSINYNLYWELWRVGSNLGEFSFGLRLPQGMIMLPLPDHPDTIVWLTSNYRIGQDPAISEGIFIGKIDVKNDKVKGYELIRGTDSLNCQLQACKHANGRDWWIIAPSINHNKYYIYSLKSEGVEYHTSYEVPYNYPISIGQTFFSPIGDKYVHMVQEGKLPSKGHLSIFDFDRSTGTLSNLRYKKHQSKGLLSGCSFSPDGSKLYFSNYDDLFQLDMTKDNPLEHMTLVAKSDFYPSIYPSGNAFENIFTFLSVAPDGKIY